MLLAMLLSRWITGGVDSWVVDAVNGVGVFPVRSCSRVRSLEYLSLFLS